MRTDLEAPVTEPLKACPFCQAELTVPTAVQYPKMGLARLHPGSLDDGTCPIAGWGFYDEQLAAWNTRTPDPQLLALVQEMVGVLEKGAEQFDLLSKLSRASRIREVEKGTGKKVARRKGDVLQSEAECGAAYLRATLTRAKGVMGV